MKWQCYGYGLVRFTHLARCRESSWFDVLFRLGNNSDHAPSWFCWPIHPPYYYSYVDLYEEVLCSCHNTATRGCCHWSVNVCHFGAVAETTLRRTVSKIMWDVWHLPGESSVFSCLCWDEHCYFKAIVWNFCFPLVAVKVILIRICPHCWSLSFLDYNPFFFVWSIRNAS